MRFHKYQALGNDYLVVEADAAALGPALVRRVCDRRYGVGSDGILVRVPAAGGADFGLRIFNPDGSEAEKSGNGLRIFARHLWDEGLVADAPFTVSTPGGAVRCAMRNGGRQVFVEMGRASFRSGDVPVAGPDREVVAEPLDVAGRSLRITAVTVGNPHCVVHLDEVTPALAHELGPVLEEHPLFPRRTNVQLVQVLARDRIRIEIWERGAGYTLASGSSSCSAAAASMRLGLCDGDVAVVMPGGVLRIGVAADWALTMLGPAEKVADGTLAPELLAAAGR